MNSPLSKIQIGQKVKGREIIGIVYPTHFGKSWPNSNHTAKVYTRGPRGAVYMCSLTAKGFLKTIQSVGQFFSEGVTVVDGDTGAYSRA